MTPQALSITKFIYDQLDPYDKGVDYVCFMTKVRNLASSWLCYMDLLT